MWVRLFSVDFDLFLHLDFLFSFLILQFTFNTQRSNEKKNEYISSMVKQHTFRERSTSQWHFTLMLRLNYATNRKEGLI